VTDDINHPSHYTWLPNGLEVIDICEHLGFRLGNVVKYVLRADHKGQAMKDLKKARWYLERELAKRDGSLTVSGSSFCECCRMTYVPKRQGHRFCSRKCQRGER
jgi:hypothetical protein